MRRQASAALVAGSLLLLVGAAGCNPESASQPIESPEPIAQRVDKIQNDPKLPPEAKAGMIAAIQRHSAMAPK